MIRYSSIGSTVATIGGSTADFRPYVAGYAYGLISYTGPNITAYYSTSKFMPGTSIRWEPSVSFTTSGRMYVGFTDNPEVIATYNAAGSTTRANIVRSLGSVVSFPVWQESDVSFPTRTRRKQFDVNASIDTSNVDALDRSCQTAMLYAVDGVGGDIYLGSFWYRDVVSVEGAHGVTT